MVGNTVCPSRLADSVALVTGSTHGIGLGIAKRFAREGATVVVNDHGEHDGERVAEALPGEATYVEADLRDPNDIEHLIETAVAEYGRIDTLVNNVGEGRNGPPDELTIEEWDFTMETTLRSQWLCVKHAMEHMPAGGSIVNVSSTNASAAVPRFFPYNVAKAGVNGLTRALAIELGPLDIRVNGIEPGLILVDEPGATDEQLEQERTIDPAGRWGRPSDVAGLAAFLASDDAAFVTGTTIPVDGGRHAVLVDDQYTDHPLLGG